MHFLSPIKSRGNGFFLCFFIFILVASCSRENKPKDYFPLISGSIYTYGDGLSRREVYFYDHKSDYDLYEIKNFTEDSIYLMKDQIILSDKYIFWYGFQSADFGKIYFDPPFNLIPTINDSDTSMTAVVREIRSATTGDDIYTLRITYHYLGKEKTIVPAGEFETIHYRYSIQYIGRTPEEALMDFSGDWWFARDVGLIKQSAAEMMLELTDYYIP